MNQMEEAMKKAGLTRRQQQPAALRQMDEAQISGRLRNQAEDALYNLLAWVGWGQKKPDDPGDLREYVRGLIEQAMASERAHREVGRGQDPGTGR